MLIDLSQAVGNYLHDVFVAKFQWWVLLGYIAQIMFTMRFVVQWVASERAGKMVMPIAFWFFSIGGGVLLFAYQQRRSWFAADRRRAYGEGAARELDIAPKTADNHIQSLYSKIGVTTRAGAALFALEQGLVA